MMVFTSTKSSPTSSGGQVSSKHIMTSRGEHLLSGSYPLQILLYS